MRGFRCRRDRVPRGTAWARMSDHLPLVAELEARLTRHGRCGRPRGDCAADRPCSMPSAARRGAGARAPPSSPAATRCACCTAATSCSPRCAAPSRGAQHEVWLATYIFPTTTRRRAMAEALRRGGAARRAGARGRRRLRLARPRLARLRELDAAAGVRAGGVPPARPLVELAAAGAAAPPAPQAVRGRRASVAFVGGINMIDDRSTCATARRRAAAGLRGRAARPGGRAASRRPARAVWTRAAFGTRLARGDGGAGAQRRSRWRARAALLRACAWRAPAAGGAPHGRLPRRCARPSWCATTCASAAPSSAATSRRVRARASAHRHRLRRTSIRAALFRRALAAAAQRGVQVRLLLQGKLDYRIAALRRAACCTTSCCAHGVRIFEYTPAFLHAKVAVVDDDWATVGSSNIDPLSLLLNLEANVIVRDHAFAAELSRRSMRRWPRRARSPTRRVASAGGRWCCAASSPGVPTGSCAWRASRAATRPTPEAARRSRIRGVHSGTRHCEWRRDHVSGTVHGSYG